jgi:hypothetical protein
LGVFRAIRAVPPSIVLAVSAVLLVAIFLVVNWFYQAWRKPTEVFFPVSGAMTKTPAQTWRAYGALFRKHSTAVITPELLAALAQIEGAGNPMAQTYWRWRASWNPFEIYRPASSAVGMYQITDSTFRDARRYCIHDHVVAEDGPWYDLRSCWFNSLYTRVVPSHAIEMTSAYLDRSVAGVLGGRAASATSVQREDVAAVIHLCGVGAAALYMRRGFRAGKGQRCGDQDLAAYLAIVNTLKRQFSRLSKT